jgi:FixJ family two-component response regulator/signal transduction histidine kinase
VFERLLADLSARFANVPCDRIVGEIETALRQMVDLLGYERCTYCEFAPDGTLHVLCSAAIDGVQPLPRGPLHREIPWLLGEIRAGRVVALSDLPHGLPPHAAAEAARVREIGLRSHLSIPLRAGGRVAGAISFGGLRRARNWPGEVVTRLSIIGEVFAGALARARSEEEAQHLRARLWHADRIARTGALSAAIAHELNQPLAAILSNAQAGLAYLDGGQARTDDIRAALEAVVRAEKRAADTIRAMRALLRHDESGRARIDLAATMRDVLQLLAAELRRHAIRVQTDFARGCFVMADRVQIEQVALNMILNAVTAMQACPFDARRLRVAVAHGADTRVIVAMSDTGVGIAPTHLAAVFEPFWTSRREGLGLGLSICRSIVEAHGGEISVAVNADQGVTFRFDLELAAADGDRPVAEPATDAAVPRTAAQPAICVIDDDESVREALARLLAAAGWKVAIFASATAFLERAPHLDVACLLLDNRMPDMSGLELQQHLASRSCAPPIIFLTGNGDVATGVEAMKHGAVDFLTKPVDGQVLVAAVRRALECHAGERERTRAREASRALVERLSAREREVLEQVIRGRLNKQIAADLDIAEQTVKQHRGRVMEKLSVRSVPELMRLCEASELFAASRQVSDRVRVDPAAPARTRAREAVTAPRAVRLARD